MAQRPRYKEGSPAHLQAVRSQEWRDEQPLVTRCAFCPWSFEGTAGEGREAAVEHRAVHAQVISAARRERRSAEVEAKLLKERSRVQSPEDKRILRTLAERQAPKARQARAHRRGGARQGSGRKSLLTPARLEAVRMELAGGASLHAIAHTYWSAWGYKSAKCAHVALLKRIPREERPVVSQSRLTGQMIAVTRRLLQEGFPLQLISDEAHTTWGYGRARTLEHALRVAGITSPHRRLTRFPDLNRGEALALIQEAA